jgi:hypothetical protein
MLDPEDVISSIVGCSRVVLVEDWEIQRVARDTIGENVMTVVLL